MIVIKRDGTEVSFDKNKIINAVNKALVEVDGQLYETETAEYIADVVEAHAEGAQLLGETLSVEDIQDRVEDLLMQSERRDVARAYIRYRYKKEVARKHKDDFITAIGGVPVKYPMRNECCGAYVALKNDELPKKRSKMVLESAREKGAEMVITACPLCLYNLEQNGGDMLPVKYFTELLAIALGVKDE